MNEEVSEISRPSKMSDNTASRRYMAHENHVFSVTDLKPLHGIRRRTRKSTCKMWPRPMNYFLINRFFSTQVFTLPETNELASTADSGHRFLLPSVLYYRLIMLLYPRSGQFTSRRPRCKEGPEACDLSSSVRSAPRCTKAMVCHVARLTLGSL